MTDLSEFLPLLASNIERNSAVLENRCSAQILDWNEPSHLESLPSDIDLVLISDCVYYEDSLRPLVGVLEALKAREILMSYEVRESEIKRQIEKSFFELMKASGFKSEDLTKLSHPDYLAVDELKIIKFKREEMS